MVPGGPAFAGHPTGASYPFGIVAGPDGNLWFTEIYGNNIAVIRPQTVRPPG